MGLTADVELSLRDTGLIAFFEEHREAFAEIAAASYGYVEGYLVDVDLPVRRDDVGQTLVNALVTNEPLREILAEKKLRQKYWYQRFGDLILDRLWEDLEDEQEQPDND